MNRSMQILVMPVLGGGLLAGAQAFAQTEAPSGRALEEVIVTAQKREASLQDTPIAVTAFSGEELSRALINNALDIQMSIPNMLMSKGQFNSSNIAIRGLGNSAVGAATDGGTGVHFNGVYLTSSQIFESEYYDVARVEVLRGPQGTLYGRNTTAGVINVITARPTDEFGGDIELQLGDYESVKGKGAINIPLGDHWSQRFAGFYLSRDGFVDNTFKNEDVDGRDMYSLRSSTAWQGENTDAVLVVNYFSEDSTRMRGSNLKCKRDPDGIIGCLPTGLADEQTNSAATVAGFFSQLSGLLLGQQFPQDDFLNSINYKDPRKQALDFTPRYEVEEWITNLEINHRFGDLTLTSLTGYYQNDYDARNDYDLTVASEPWPVEVEVQQGPDGTFTANNLYSTDRSSANGEQWSQELRLASDYAGDWNFLLGGFWLDYEAQVDYQVYSASVDLYGQLIGLPQLQRQFWANTDPYQLDSWATFGELYWQASERVQLTFGLRYTEEEKKSRQRTVYLNFLNDPNLPGGGFDEFEGDWDEVTGKFNVSFDYSDEVLMYATLSRSYKSGGFNPISSDSPLLDPEQGGDPGQALFDPEYINALELGVKSRFLDNRLQANATAFYYDFEGLQVSKITNQTSINENVEESTIQGVEVELLFAPTLNWRFSANFAWLDTEIKDFETVDPANINQLGTTENIVTGPIANTYIGPGCPNGAPSCDGLPVSLKGNSLPNSPEFSVNLGAAYTWMLDNGMNLTAGTNYYWQDSFYTRVFNTVNDEVDEWNVWNGTLLLESADRSWYTEAWIRNITDEDSVTGQWLADQNLGLITAQFLLEPRTYGITLGYHF